MKPRYRVALIMAAFILLFPLSARSEIKEGSAEVGVFGGYNHFQPAQNLSDRPVFGARVGYNLTSHFGFEGVLESVHSRVKDASKTGTREGQFRSPTDSVRSTFYHIDVVYHLIPEGRINPYLVAGFGGAHYSPKISNRNMAGINAGVGVKFWISEHLAIRTDIRDYMVSEIFQESYHNIAATLGITFAFGGGSKSESKPADKPVDKPAAKPLATPADNVKSEPKAKEVLVQKAKEVVVVRVAEPKVVEKVAVIAAQPKIEEKIVVLALEDIHFDFNKSTLTPESQEILKKNIQLLMKNPKSQVRIAGYTSASGTEEYNQLLSERRANAVEKYLVEEGVISADRLSVIGHGESRPAEYEAAPSDIYSDEAMANMRVLFEISIK